MSHALHICDSNENHFMTKEITVSISFAEEDADFAEKIVHGLLDKGIHVKSNSKIIRNKIPNWGRHLLDIVSDQFSDSVDYCLVLVTRNYSKSKWNNYSKCSLLESAYNRKNFILPVKVGENTSPLSGLALIDYLEVEENDFQYVIDSFLEKAKISNEGFEILKGYKDIDDILRLYDSKVDWVKLSNEEDNNNEKRIAFDLYASNDKLLERVSSYILYLYEGITIKNTFEYINERYKYVFRDKNLIILIPYESGQVDFEKRKANIKRAFNDSKVIYIKDFIWEYCTPKDFRIYKNELPLANFIIPKVLNTSNNILEADKFIMSWLNEDENPLLVIKGSGGIGKTTLAKWVTNYVEKEIPNTRAIFIDSAEITSYLHRSIEITNELDLYKFYEADFEERLARNKLQGKKLGSTEFKCNLDNGNIILIIDGFDEVLTHLDSFFDINSFISSVFSLSSNIGKGKVVITTRNYFWDKHNVHKGFEYQTIEVCPFDKQLAHDFFSTYFNGIDKFIEKAFLVTEELMLSGTNNDFIPFVLDLVAYIIENRYDSDVIKDSKFESDLLKLKINNDYLLFKICDREIIKLDKVLTVDNQINLFIKLATKYNGKINDAKLLEELKEVSSKRATNKTLEAIKTHPILVYSSNQAELGFKYDLFEEHFKNIYTGLLFIGTEEVNSKLISILADFNNYNSFFIDILLQRICDLDDEKKITAIHIIESIKKHKPTERDISIEIKNRAISSIFLILLKLTHKQKSNSIQVNTNLLLELFSSNNVVKDFSLVNCNSLTSTKIIFDFSGLSIVDSTFSSYEYFGDCKFDNKTAFENCKFENLNLVLSKSYEFKSHNFISPYGDINFKEYFTYSNKEKYNTKKDIIEDFESLLKLFNKSGKIYNISKVQLKNRYHPKVIPLEKILKELTKKELLVEYTNSSKVLKYDVADAYKYSVIKYLTNGTNSQIIEFSLSTLISNYK